VGDQNFQAKCLGKMGEVSRGGRTVLFISHAMDSVNKLCTRTLLLEKGRLKEQGKTQTVVRDYVGTAFKSTERSTKGDFDLSHSKARGDIYLPIIRRLQLHAGDGKLKSFFYPDESFVADVILEVDKPISDAVVALAIEDSLGHRITTSATWFSKEPIGTLRGRCHFSCVFPQLRLGSGQYLISLSVFNKENKFFDMLPNAAMFEVGWRDNYGNGAPYHSLYGPVLNSAVWKRLY
jgi:lipopolysaccharide transport system ATP-binding protein